MQSPQEYGAGSEGGHYSAAESPGASGKGRKQSQRPTLACSECTRRKTKCDKTIPCGQCLKRGKSHLCHQAAPPNSRPQNGHPSSLHPSGLASLTPPDPRAAVFAELQSVTQTVDELRDRIASLEQLLAQALPPASQSQQPAPQPNYYDRRAQGAYYGAAAGSAYGREEVYQGQEGEGYDELEGDGDERGSIGASEERNAVRAGSDEGKQAAEELEASEALEFLALGRTRPFGTAFADTSAAHASHAAPPLALEQRRMSPPPAQPHHPHPRYDPLHSHSRAYLPAPTGPSPYPAAPVAQQYPTPVSLADSVADLDRGEGGRGDAKRIKLGE